MRRLILLAAILALVAGACGDDEGTGTASASTTTTKAAVTTTTTATITTAATTTTADPAAPRIALALVFAGEWEGDWDNTTYGSTGPATLTVAVDPEARTATLIIDLGGSVFGEGDPEPFEFVADLTAASPFVAATPLLGDVTFEVDAVGHFTLTALDVPGAGIASFEARGIADPEGIDLGYTVTFEAGGGAEGIASLRRANG
jgi:hypothetical protein